MAPLLHFLVLVALLSAAPGFARLGTPLQEQQKHERPFLISVQKASASHLAQLETSVDAASSVAKKESWSKISLRLSHPYHKCLLSVTNNLNVYRASFTLNCGDYGYATVPFGYAAYIKFRSGFASLPSIVCSIAVPYEQRSVSFIAVDNTLSQDYDAYEWVLNENAAYFRYNDLYLDAPTSWLLAWAW